jgi:hypothetical protein
MVTQGDFLNACEKLLAAATATAGQPAVDNLRQELETNTTGAKEAQARRNLHKFQAQEASRDMDRFMGAARKLYSRLRNLLIGVYGPKAEELVQFGIQPFRSRQGTLESKAKRWLAMEEKKEKPSGPGVAPTRTADSQTESTS